MSENRIVTPSPEEKAENLDSMITAAEAGLAGETKIRRNSRVVELATIAVVFAILQVSKVVYIPLPEKYIDTYYIPALEFATLFAALYCLVKEARFRMKAGRQAADLELLKAKKRFRDELPSAGAEPETKDYFSALVRINVDNLAGYYSLVKIHTDKSFVVALAMGVAGFVLLAIGLVLGFVKNERAELMTYISTGSGVMTEFIAAVFFYLYNRTIRQMKGYHDSLLDVQNILLALKLVDDTEESSDRVKMIGQMLAYLLTKRAAVEPEEANPPKTELVKAVSVS